MDKSAGCIIVKEFDAEPHVLMIHAAGNWRNKKMGFPKGEIHNGESPHETAIRETKEEVGITPIILDSLGTVKTRSGKKEVHAFIALYGDGPLDDKKATKLQKGEVDYAKFFPIDSAIEMCYEYQRPLFERAKKYIEKKGL